MPARGWQMISGEIPQCWVQAFDDVIRREGNTIRYQFNVSAGVGNVYGRGYWDYPWFVDLSVNGQNLSANRLIKPYTGWRRVIRGQEHWMHLHSGHYTGSVQINSLATSIRFRIGFHDTVGNTGAVDYWIPIPRAGAPHTLRDNCSDITYYSAKIDASCINPTPYAKITKWKIQYGYSSTDYTSTISNTTNLENTTFYLSSLDSGTRYYYKLIVHTDIGLKAEKTGSFMTEDLIYAKKIRHGETPINTRAVIIYPDGKTKRIEGVKIVQ